jgi:hypothetical protein
MIEETKVIPIGVKVISIIGIILGGIGLLLTPIFLLAASFSGGPNSSISNAEAVFGLIILILPSILIILLSIMLLKIKNWARITFVILFLLIAILTIADQSKLFQQWMDLGALYYINLPLAFVGLIISGYLIFSKKVKEAFSNK